MPRRRQRWNPSVPRSLRRTDATCLALLAAASLLLTTACTDSNETPDDFAQAELCGVDRASMPCGQRPATGS